MNLGDEGSDAIEHGAEGRMRARTIGAEKVMDHGGVFTGVRIGGHSVLR